MSVQTSDVSSAAAMVAEARAGDEAAFTRLVAAYHQDLVRVAFAITGDPDMAADAAQLAWNQAWRKLSRIRDAARVRSWLVAIAANEARQLGRQIAFVGSPKEPLGGHELFVINADGTGLARFDNPEGHLTGLAWSPDGSLISLVASGSAGQSSGRRPGDPPSRRRPPDARSGRRRAGRNGSPAASPAAAGR